MMTGESIQSSDSGTVYNFNAVIFRLYCPERVNESIRLAVVETFRMITEPMALATVPGHVHAYYDYTGCA